MSKHVPLFLIAPACALALSRRLCCALPPMRHQPSCPQLTRRLVLGEGRCRTAPPARGPPGDVLSLPAPSLTSQRLAGSIPWVASPTANASALSLLSHLSKCPLLRPPSTDTP